MAIWFRISLAAALLAVPLWIAEMTPAHASCVATTLDEQVANADLIVVGTWQDIRLLGPMPTPPPLSGPNDFANGRGGPAELTIAVEEYVKGDGPAELLVYVSETVVVFEQGAPPFVAPLPTSVEVFQGSPGGRYLLFLFGRPDGRYTSDSCQGSVKITAENEAEVLALIEQIRAILQAPAPTATVSDLPPLGSGGGGSGGPTWALVGAAGAGALLAATALLTLGRRAK